MERPEADWCNIRVRTSPNKFQRKSDQGLVAGSECRNPETMEGIRRENLGK